MTTHAATMPRTRLTRRLIAAVWMCSLVGLGALVSPAGAQTQCTTLDPLGTKCSITDLIEQPMPEPGTSIVRSQAPPGPRFVWLNTYIGCEAESADQWSVVTSISQALRSLTSVYSTSDANVPGEVWVGELVDPSSGGTDHGYIGCVEVATAGPAKPPPIPTAEQIWGQALTGVPSVKLDPFVRGLTGMETRMWYEGAVSDSVQLTLDGYWITADIEAVGFSWEMGGPDLAGRSIQQSNHPGSADNPAATHTYASASDVRIIHEVVWVGTAVMGGPGIPGSVIVDLGEAKLFTARDYEVIQVRTPVVRGD